MGFIKGRKITDALLSVMDALAWKGEEDLTPGTNSPVDIVVIYNQLGLVTFGSGLTSNGEFAAHLTNQNILAGCYTPPPALPAGTTGPVFGQSASCHLFRRWPLDFGTTPEE
jgi:hypothetical protein